jgi:hypothetical protein
LLFPTAFDLAREWKPAQAVIELAPGPIGKDHVYAEARIMLKAKIKQCFANFDRQKLL